MLRNKIPFRDIAKGRYGRKIAYTDVEMITANNISNVIGNCIGIFNYNKTAIEYLWNYYKGDQPVLYRTIQKEKAKTAQYKEKAEKADELQKKIDDFEAGNLTELDKANKALETANQQIAELQKNNAIRDLREKAMTDFRITAEQAKEVVGDDGNFDTAALGKIMSEKETAAAQAKEQEIANGSTNPGGGSAGGDKNKEKTADVENAENITFGIETNVEDQNHYVI